MFHLFMPVYHRGKPHHQTMATAVAKGVRPLPLLSGEGPVHPPTTLYPAVLQVKLYQPADLESSVALRSEEDGFWPRAVSAMVQALWAAAGYPKVGGE